MGVQFDFPFTVLFFFVFVVFFFARCSTMAWISIAISAAIMVIISGDDGL